MSDWTEDLFVNHPELFVKALEERVPMTTEEIDFLLKYIKEQGFRPKRILDLNCGIGRHSIELAKRGLSILGTDISPYYIQIANKRAKTQKLTDKAQFKVADMRKISTVLAGERFDGIINLYTSFGYYDDNTNNDILRQCYNLVRPKGFFAMEIMNRDWIVRNFQPQGFARYENMIVLEDRKFDPKTSRMETTWTYLVQKDHKNYTLEKQVTINHRIWSLHELIDTFQKTGWKFKAAYPGLRQLQENTPLTEAGRLLFIATKTARKKESTT